MSVRECAFVAHLALLLGDSWAHPETKTQATTWGLVIHVLAFGCGGSLKKFFAAPALFYAHGVLAGWLLFTWRNPECAATLEPPGASHLAPRASRRAVRTRSARLDRQDKVDLWGCTVAQGLARTAAVHIFPVVCHWSVLFSELAEQRKLYGGHGTGGLLLRGVGVSFVVFVAYGLCNIGALGLPGLELLPKMTANYNIRGVSEQRLTDEQTACLLAAHAAAFLLWRPVVKGGAAKPKGGKAKRK